MKHLIKTVTGEKIEEVPSRVLVYKDKIEQPSDLRKPQQDTNFAHEAAKLLKDIVKQNGWAKNLGGKFEHLQYEAWQTIGKYYGYTVKTGEAEPVEVLGAQGFKATAKVINERTGVEVGGSEAYCLRDEFNWKSKPAFQLASMAQTRAGSKALRQILGFVVALAGYNPTPSEEIVSETVSPDEVGKFNNLKSNGENMITKKQELYLLNLLAQRGFSEEDLKTKYHVSNPSELSAEQASTIISNLLKLPTRNII